MARGHALLTGAIGGLGTAMAESLAREGIPVIATDRRAEDFEAWKEQVSPEARANLTFHPLDVTLEEQIEELAQRLDSQGVEIAYLINNAGIQGNAPVWEMDSRTWNRVIRVNLNGTFLLTRAFSKGMVDRGFGRIVNFASVYAYIPGQGQSPYAAAKAGITGYTRSTARDLGPHGVTVNVIAPGLIWHERLRGVLPDKVFEDMVAMTPVGRAGKPEEIAATVMFLLSDGAAFITGQTIHVNGGAYLPG
jgi:3-oxoacyl-[acyl-carrier protein] reductase